MLFQKTSTTGDTVNRIEESEAEGGAVSADIADSLKSAFTAVMPTVIEAAENGGAVAIANGDAASLASSLVSSAASAFGDTSNAKAAGVKKPVRDPLKAAFSAKGPPEKSAFITNPTRGGLDSLGLFSEGENGAVELNRTKAVQMAAVAGRMGTPPPSTDKELKALQKKAGLAVAETAASESFSSIKAEDIQWNGPSLDAPGVSADDIVSFAKFAAGQAGNALGGDTASILASGFDATLPKLADSLGNAIPNLPTDFDPNTLDMIKRVGSSLLGIAQDTFCGGNYTDYSNQQNLFNGLAGHLADQGIVCALISFLNSGRANGSTRNVLRGKADGISRRGMASMLGVVADAVGPGTVGNAVGLSANLIRKGTLDTYDISAISTTLDTLSVEATDIFSGEGETSGDKIVWNTKRISESDPATVDALLGAPITKMTKRTSPVKPESIKWNSPAGISI